MLRAGKKKWKQQCELSFNVGSLFPTELLSWWRWPWLNVGWNTKTLSSSSDSKSAPNHSNTVSSRTPCNKYARQRSLLDTPCARNAFKLADEPHRYRPDVCRPCRRFSWLVFLLDGVCKSGWFAYQRDGAVSHVSINRWDKSESAGGVSAPQHVMCHSHDDCQIVLCRKLACGRKCPYLAGRLISTVLCFIEVCGDGKDSSSDVKVCLFGHNKDVKLKEDEWLTSHLAPKKIHKHV